MVFLVAMVVAGCGGQSGEQGGGTTAKVQGEGTALEQAPQGGTSEGRSGGAKRRADAPEVRIAPGEIVSVNPENRRFVLKPSRGDRMVFKVLPKAKIERGGREAELADMKRGQKAQVRYVVRDRGVKNRARSITLFENGSAGGGATG